MIPLCLMGFALFTYHREEKYRFYYGIDQLFKEMYKKNKVHQRYLHTDEL